MKIIDIQEEDCINYKNVSMFITMGTCTWKCCIEAGIPISVCQNMEIAKVPRIEIDAGVVVSRFLKNTITESVVVGGLEPFDDMDSLTELCARYGEQTALDIVVYTGYNKNEIVENVAKLKRLLPNNVFIVKYGRYVPDKPSRFDEVLGITLVSDNQYAEIVE